jgi:prephenate dehydrogenase
MSFIIKRLAVIGLGLIGGSLIQALKELDLVGEVVGIDRHRATLDLARNMGIIDHAYSNATEGVAGASMVVIATPVSSIAPMLESCAAFLPKGCIVTDVGSVKGTVVRHCEALLPEGVHFVGGHPIAGRERAGLAAAFPALFQGSRTILTPTPRTPLPATEMVRLVWEAVGSKVEIMDADYHDRVLAATSHLPHLIAYNVVNTLADLEDHMRAEVFRYAAGGFRDFTRIASSDPTMWRDICLENQEAILDILDRFRKDLNRLEQRVRDRDADGLYGIFARSKNTRDRILEETRILHGPRNGES